VGYGVGSFKTIPGVRLSGLVRMLVFCWKSSEDMDVSPYTSLEILSKVSPGRTKYDPAFGVRRVLVLTGSISVTSGATVPVPVAFAMLR
jgi:hypothetical protein